MLNLSSPEQHQLRIARDTLKLSDMGAAALGEPDKRQARRIILELTGRFYNCLDCGGPCQRSRADHLCTGCRRHVG